MTAIPCGREWADLSLRRRRVVWGLTLVVLVFSALRFDGPAAGYWDTYITVPAMFMAGERVELLRIDGTPRYSYELTGRVPDDTYDPSPGGFGIASQDQRIGTGILFAAPFSLLGQAAFRWGFAAAWAATFLFSFIGFRRLAGGFGAPLAAAIALVANPFSLYIERLNGNLFGLAVLALLWVLSTEARPRFWLIGLIYGVLGGIRNEAIVLGPVMLALLARGSGGWGAFARRLGAFTAAAFVAILPVLLWNRFAYGQMLIHPSQVAALEGFRPTFPHSFLGAEFRFNGLLNWPFHDHVVRTPHFAFPTAVHWMLVTVKSLGVVLAALAAVGAIVLLRRRPFEGWCLAAWWAIVFGLFAAQENWEELKQTFMALHLFPLFAFAAAGIAWLAEAPRDRRRLAVTAGSAAAIAAAVLGARAIDAPADERWYVRFPHAARNDAGLDGLPEERRKDWHFFYTRESAAEIAIEREHMTTPSPLPALYRPIRRPDVERIARAAREPWERGLTALAVWSYIYGE
ncbi:MAG: hypothetical protein FJ087_09020 [Deltaproteobacteria bacterium]|nr:hypothetical protein [Deltaproteobacteria bacterium]